MSTYTFHILSNIRIQILLKESRIICLFFLDSLKTIIRTYQIEGEILKNKAPTAKPVITTTNL